eukprot:gnl/TRDRNA2_/TRDRNA2_156714_c1_seq2.p1 gnl/TRDRNA2_/TRDRNA2_156714_c1~~gnl/TRDRNA2_/TRDRNA2_156714_c1_seq2.p1  ORF type:complete len:464 (-),score=91.28 gnl/TRDRNA2_/TRDRNA2_156714_c1_seq2:587-1933(-)
MASGPDEVYRCTYQRVVTRNQSFYSRYPGDVAKVREIVSYLDAADGGAGVALSGGGRLSARRFLSLGVLLGSGYGLETMHWLVESAFVDTSGGNRELDDRFLTQVEAVESFDTNPLYWLLHEAIYCGPETGASRWSAQRMLAEAAFHERFDYRAALRDPTGPPVLFTGEMVYSWFADDFATLRPLAEAAELLAAKDNWPPLYDLEVLRNTTVPAAAHVDSEDIFVEVVLSKQTAELLGQKCKLWVSDEFQHSGLNERGGSVLNLLIEMASGKDPLARKGNTSSKPAAHKEPSKPPPARANGAAAAHKQKETGGARAPPPRNKNSIIRSMNSPVSPPQALPAEATSATSAKFPGESQGKALSKLLNKPLAPRWVIVGGADKGGILVREGSDLKSAQVSERLATGAIVEQLEIISDRLRYRLLEGTGPPSGWVSIRISGKVLVQPFNIQR